MPFSATASRVNGPGGYYDMLGTGQVLAAIPDQRGIFQLYVDEQPAPWMPASLARAHKHNPVWHPDGRHIAVQLESLPNWWSIINLDGRDNVFLVGNPREGLVNGLFENIAIIDTHTGRVQVITDLHPWQADGFMAPHFSHDGRLLLYSRMVAPPGQPTNAVNAVRRLSAVHRRRARAMHAGVQYQRYDPATQRTLHYRRLAAAAGAAPLVSAPFGTYKLYLRSVDKAANGDLIIGPEKDITPPGHVFCEAHGFTIDDEAVLFCSDYGVRSPSEKHVWNLDLTTGVALNMTAVDFPTYWNEHARDTVDGVVFLSSKTADIWCLPSDGAPPYQVTEICKIGSPSYQFNVFPTRTTGNLGNTVWYIDCQQYFGLGYPTRRRVQVLIGQ